MPAESSPTIAYMSASSKTAAYHHDIANGVLLMFDGKVKLVNKELLRSVSQVFAAAFDGKFANADNNSYRIDGHSEKVVLQMLKCIQRGEVEVESTVQDEDDDDEANYRVFMRLDRFKYIWPTDPDGSDSKGISRAIEFCLDVFLLADEYDITALRQEAQELIVELRRRTLCLGNIRAADEVTEKVLELYETNCIGLSLREDLVWSCALSQQDPSRLWYKVEGRYETVDGFRQHIKDDWVAWEPRHASFVREMAELRRKIEEAQCE